MKKIYFISDFHLGVPTRQSSREREKKIVRWLEMVKHDAAEIYLLGDVFDFWFEYKHAVPRGYVRLLGKLGELSDAGIRLHYFTGNHDMWVFDYLPAEINCTIYRKPIVLMLDNKKFFIGHGDGLGPGDRGYKFIKSIFASRISQWLFARFHPNFGYWLANLSSRKSRAMTGDKDERYLGDDKEMLVQFCKTHLKSEHIDFFIFGHRHLKIDMMVEPTSRYINLGEWINHSNYAEWNGTQLNLLSFER